MYLWTTSSDGVLHAVSIMYPRTTSSAGVLRAVSLTDSRKPQGQKARKSRRFFVNFANFIINLPLLLSIYNYSAPRGNAKSSGRGACSPDRAFAFPRGGQGAQRLWTPLVPNAQHLGRGVLNCLALPAASAENPDGELAHRTEFLYFHGADKARSASGRP